MYLILLVPIIAIMVTLIARYRILKEPEGFVYNYSAKTNLITQDHSYQFAVKKKSDGYRCYIEKVPAFRGRDTSNYMPHYLVEKITGRYYICWTGKMRYSEQAKTLCRNWADATQKFIDTGEPAPGFGR